MRASAEAPAGTGRPLTKKQKAILAWFKKYVEKHGLNPTVQEAADAFRLTRNPMECHFRLIAKKGHLRLNPGIKRGTTLARNA
jgi:SOS-response transcriptional repressor LexA